MAKGKNRNAATLVSLLLILIALIIVYLWYNNRDTTSEDTEDAAETIDLAEIDTDQISSIHYIKDDADFTFILEDEVWIAQEEPERPINQDYITKILSTFDDIRADRIIMEEPESPADYGLEEPSAYLQVKLTDGTAVTVQIGDKAGGGDGYYGYVNEDGIVYLLPAECGTALQYNAAELTEVEEDPDIDADNIKHISIVNRDGKDYELKYMDEEKLDNSGNNMYSWEILKPYGEGFTAESTNLAQVLENYESFSFISCVDYKGEDLSLYGLDDPMASIYIGYNETHTETLEEAETDPDTGEEITEKTYYEAKEFKIYIGDANEDGYYYVRKDGSNFVYTMRESSIDTMLEIDAFSLLNPYICIPNIANVDEVVFDIEGTEYLMQLEHTAVTNDDGEEEIQTAYYFNGSEVEEDAFKELYQVMISARYDAEITKEVDTEGAEPFMTMNYHIFGDNERTVSASLVPYDDSFYIVSTNAGTLFFADKREIDDIAAAVAGFTGVNEE